MKITKLYSTIGFPEMFNSRTGKTRTVSLVQSINESLDCLMKSQKGELYGDPYYGTKLRALLFSPISVGLKEELKLDLEEAIKIYEPRIKVSNIDITTEDTTVNITITYYIVQSMFEGSYTLAVNIGNF